VGVSRGADLLVVGATQQSLLPRPAGAIALALTRETDEIRDTRPLKRRGRGRDTLPNGQVLPYVRLKQAYDIPISVIQSTNDHYGRAGGAGGRSGRDAGMRRFGGVGARNQGFGGARDAMLRELAGALDWIESILQRGAAPSGYTGP